MRGWRGWPQTGDLGMKRELERDGGTNWTKVKARVLQKEIFSIKRGPSPTTYRTLNVVCPDIWNIHMLALDFWTFVFPLSFMGKDTEQAICPSSLSCIYIKKKNNKVIINLARG